MRARASVVAVAAISPLGGAEEAVAVTAVGRPAPVAIRPDEEMLQLGFLRPFAARVPSELLARAAPHADRAQLLLDHTLEQLLAALAPWRAARPAAAGADRVALVLGTSSGGMRSAEQLFEARAKGLPVSRELAEAATYFAPFAHAVRLLGERGLALQASMQLVTACAASTWALGVGLRWLARGKVDLVIAGGYDALGPFVASGFECLRATSASLPAPFRVGRDGMALGEGSGLLALVREGEERGLATRFFVSGFGASTDAVHITAPDRTGGGLARAATAALDDAGISADSCALVSAHATSTPFNDAMEARAIHAVFGERDPIVHPFKAQIGHTLGAAGVLETIALGVAIEAQVAPAAAGSGPLDPDAKARLLERAEPCSIEAGLKLSAAFGGANAALVLERAGTLARSTARAKRPVYLRAFAAAQTADVASVAAASGYDADKIARADALSTLLATAVARLDAGAIAGAGIIVGHGLATIDINERFYARVLAKGPTAAEPRVFPPTSPNLMPGQVAIFFGLRGPSAAIASGPRGALHPLLLAAELVAWGDAEQMLACSVDIFGSASKFVIERAFAGSTPAADGAVVALLSAEPAGALAEVDLDASGAGFTHEALLAELERLAGARPA